MEEREAVGGSDSVVCFLTSVLAEAVPQAGDQFVVSTFSDTDPTQLSRYEFSMPLNNDFLLEYVGIEYFGNRGINGNSANRWIDFVWGVVLMYGDR